MADTLSRRTLLAAAGMAAAGLAGAQEAGGGDSKILIIGVSCSPRKGKTTATSIGVALEAARGVDARIETELFDLGEMNIAANPASGAQDDLSPVLASLKKANLGGIIIGSPTYYRTMTALCKTFIERLSVLRDPTYVLADKAVGALSVGGYRNGGQELVLAQIQTAMLCHDVMIVGGKPPAHQGATLWNSHKDDIMQDEIGIQSAKNLGARVAQAALKMAAKPA